MSPGVGWPLFPRKAGQPHLLQCCYRSTLFNPFPLVSSFFSKNNNFTRINFCSHTYHMIVKKLAPHFKRILYFTFSEYRISWYQIESTYIITNILSQIKKLLVGTCFFKKCSTNMRNINRSHICVQQTFAYADIIRIYSHKNDRLHIFLPIICICEKCM